MNPAAETTWNFDHVVTVIGLILIPLAAMLTPFIVSWQRRRVEDAVARARREGAEAAMVEAQKQSNKALHDRMTRYGRRLVRLEQEREILIEKGVIPAGSQVGDEGRGARNPMLDPDEDG